MSIPNKEHLEAANNDAKLKIEKFKSELPESDRKKFEAIEKARQILMDAGVKCYLFPFLPSDTIPNSQCVWQFNTVSELSEFGRNGFFTDKSAEENGLYYCSLIAAIYQHFKGLGAFKGEDLEEEFRDFASWVFERIRDFAVYCDEKYKKNEGID